MIITSKQLKAMLGFASADKTRTHIASLRFTCRSVVATDGTCLAIATDGSLPEDRGLDCTIPRDIIETAIKAAGTKGSVKVENDRLTIMNGATVFDLPFKSGANFPAWTQVVPASDKGVTHWHGVNPELLARMVPMQAAFFHGNGVTLKVSSGELDPVRYDWGKPGAWSGSVVIMPMRVK